MEINITLQPKQKEALYKSFEYENFFYGGSKGGGKSYLIRAREVYRRLKYKNTKGLIVRKTYPELLSNHIRMFFKEYPETVKWYNKSEKTIYWPNGSTTEFSHLNRTDDVYSYQGREYEDISIDEITQHEEEVIQILRSSLRTTNKDIKPTLVMTGNPGGVGMQWVKRLFIKRMFEKNENPNDYFYVPAKVYDNQALIKADPKYIDRLKALPEDLIRAYLEGDWDVFSGQYFTEFRRDIHCCNPFTPKKELTKYGGIDWGYDPGYFVFESCALQEKKLDNGQIIHRAWMYKDISGQRKSPEEWGKIIYNEVDLDEFERISCDPSMFKKKEDGSMSLIEQLCKSIPENYHNLFKKANNDRIPGWTYMRNWLSIAPDGKPYMFISENCKDLINMIPEAVHDSVKPEDVDPLSGKLHWLDSTRYCLHSIKWIDGKMGIVNDISKNSIPTFIESINPSEIFVENEEPEVDWRTI